MGLYLSTGFQTNDINISVQHINYEENEPSFEEKKSQMCGKGTVKKKWL